MTHIPPSLDSTSTPSLVLRLRFAAVASIIVCLCFVAFPGLSFSDDTPVVTANADSDRAIVSAERTDAELQAQADAARRLIAELIARRMASTIESIEHRQTIAIVENLLALESRSTKLSNAVETRIDSQLDSAMENFRVRAYAIARASSNVTYQVANQN